MTDSKFDIIMKIHNYTPFRMIRALSSHWMDPANLEMPKCVINVSSTSGLHGAMGQINYATAKAGIVGLTKTVAAEWSRYVHNEFFHTLPRPQDLTIYVHRYNVRANAVAYGWIDKRIPFDGRGDFFFCRTSPPKVPGEHPTKMSTSGALPYFLGNRSTCYCATLLSTNQNSISFY